MKELYPCEKSKCRSYPSEPWDFGVYTSLVVDIDLLRSTPKCVLCKYFTPFDLYREEER